MLKRLKTELFESSSIEARKRPQLAREDATPQPSPAHARQLEVQVSLGLMNAAAPAIKTYPGAIRALIWVSAAIVGWATIIATVRAIF